MCKLHHFRTSSGNRYVVGEKDGNVQVFKKQGRLWHDVEDDNIAKEVIIDNNEVIYSISHEKEVIRA